MRARALLLSILMLGVTLTGCLSGDDDAPQPLDAGRDDGFNTAAPEGRGRLVAFEETNATEEGIGGIDHHHDYWQGRERVVVFEQEAEMLPLSSRRAAAGYEAVATFRPELGAMIYEATDTVEFTIQDPKRRACEGEVLVGGQYVCTDWVVPRIDDPIGGPSGMSLRYKHAATTDWIDVGELVWGTPLPIKVTNPIQTDMPHATASLWEFQVKSPNQHDTTLTFTAKAELVRGNADIPLWPGHPEFYLERTERIVLARSAVSADAGAYGHGAAIVPAGAGPVHAERLISYGTRTLFVWANITDVNAPNPATAPTAWYLRYWNATGWDNLTNPFDVTNHPVEQREHLWVLPVDDNGMDSPYADGSRWRFELMGALTRGASCSSGCANWVANYEITVVASSIELEYDDYSWYCTRDDYCP